jgi:GNAT superfamily N-acetyltransferase
MTSGEETDVCALVRHVFDELVAPDFAADGVAEFYRFANPEALVERMKAGNPVVVAEIRGEIVGMLEIKPPGHITMLFVARRGEGIGRQLVAHALEICRRAAPHLDKVTVHASRFAVPIYRRLGFEPEGPERTENGIVFLPMAHAFDLRYPIGEFSAPSEVTGQQLDNWISAIESLPRQLEVAVEGLTTDQLDTPYRPGGWTIRQVVHHLADSHLNSYIRFKWALTEDRPTIKA